ncbi:TPA: hypothetical protein I3821_004069 [Enterobacter cloacae]|uniref:hypothetical protein n=1 Tax=Enterobacter cloacae TaxID=550 RepID=UPI00254E64F1|nr:hypothetical protein [Enterobacter cloacae]HAS1203983.1 hypothetical protein [Enterobacter cloacae]HAS1444024.1 hypothetical protein [Enterobacter cloacae]HAS1685373.1 hypothetical protein [Enterobacter cloacae]
MADIYQITLTTQTGETFRGKMTRSQPELVNGFVPLATETGEWLYFAPADVKRVEFTPVSAEQTEQPEEQTTE